MKWIDTYRASNSESFGNAILSRENPSCVFPYIDEELSQDACTEWNDIMWCKNVNGDWDLCYEVEKNLLDSIAWSNAKAFGSSDATNPKIIIFQKEGGGVCKFPFSLNGIEYEDECADYLDSQWCVNSFGNWGICDV